MVNLYNPQSTNSLEILLAPISKETPAGEDLYYHPIYDQIKEARREDDPILSQGVWQIDLKKADWPLVENLCYDALITKTKDLQIAAWLVEAWICRDQLEGLMKGINLIQGLSESYWNCFYPKGNDKDIERRLHMYEWLDTSFKNRLVMIPILQNPLDSLSLTLAQWMQANRLDIILKRSQDPQKILEKAEMKGEFTKEKIQQIFSSYPRDFWENLNLDTDKTLKIYENFKRSLDTLLKNNSRPAMNGLSDTLKELHRFIKAGIDTSPLEKSLKEEEDCLAPDSPPLSLPTSLQEKTPLFSSAIRSRSDAYKMINDLGNFLQNLEPHSPSPLLLKRIATWETKNISHIFQDIGDTPNDWALLMKLLSFEDKN